MSSLKIKIFWFLTLFVLVNSSWSSSSPVDGETHQNEKRRFARQVGSEDKYSDARYAAQFALLLKELEIQDKEVYDIFIITGFSEDEVPKEVPSIFSSLSRTPPRTHPNDIRGPRFLRGPQTPETQLSSRSLTRSGGISTFSLLIQNPKLFFRLPGTL